LTILLLVAVVEVVAMLQVVVVLVGLEQELGTQ
jgi:hypothetical protein